MPFTLYCDPSEPGLECCPFVVARSSSAVASVFDNGLPTGRVDWIAGGELRALAQTRHTAGRAGLPTTLSWTT